MAATITFTRTHSDDVAQRQILVSIDDGARVQLMFGESRTIEIAPGDHKLKAYNTLVWKTVPFRVEDGEHVEFQLVNRASRWLVGFLAVMGVAPLYMTIEQRKLK